jgi:hypothetical protein
MVLDLQKPEARPQMIRRALDEFRDVMANLGHLRLAAAAHDLTDARHAGWKLIGSVWECLALANQAFLTSGRIVENIPRLRARPANLEQSVREISTSSNPSEICATAERLALDTRAILRQCQSEIHSDNTVQRRFCQAYPEIHAMLGKVHSACARNDAIAASGPAWFAQYDVSRMMADADGQSHSDFNLYNEFAAPYRAVGLPELMQSSARDLPALAQQAKLFDTRMRHWLGEQAVGLSEFNTVDELARSLESYVDPRQM